MWNNKTVNKWMLSYSYPQRSNIYTKTSKPGYLLWLVNLIV